MGRGGRGGGRGGLGDAQTKLMADAIDILKRAGAVIVDPANMPTIVTGMRAKHPVLQHLLRLNNAKGKDENCSVVLKYGMKRDFNAYLATLGADGAGQVAHRVARVQHRHMRAPAPSSTARRISTSRMKWIVVAGQGALRRRPGEGHPARRRSRIQGRDRATTGWTR